MAEKEVKPQRTTGQDGREGGVTRTKVRGVSAGPHTLLLLLFPPVGLRLQSMGVEYSRTPGKQCGVPTRARRPMLPCL